MNKTKNIFVAGHNGMVGSALVRELKKNSSNTIITASRATLDLLNQAKVNTFFKSNAIDEVYLAAAKVGGIYANNKFPADFIYENLTIQTNVINAAHNNDIQKLLFLGSSCIYPKFANQPIKESELLGGLLEETNEPYAIAKIAGIKLCESFNRQYKRDYRCVMPTNLYGPGDNYHSKNSHVIPALIRRFHEAKLNKDESVHAWGTGMPKREFLFVEDMANASIYVQNIPFIEYKNICGENLHHINIGTGEDCTIKELTELISKTIGYTGKVIWDASKPDGTPRKLLDVSVLKSLGWTYKKSLHDGLKETYESFQKDFIKEAN